VWLVVGPRLVVPLLPLRPLEGPASLEGVVLTMEAKLVLEVYSVTAVPSTDSAAMGPISAGWDARRRMAIAVCKAPRPRQVHHR
jgi:hypothetical protein